AKLRTFLTTEAPKPYFRYEGDGARWRYFGHACILLETGGVSVLTDPVLSYTYESDISRYTYDDLPPVIDYVLTTHNHQAHLLFAADSCNISPKMYEHIHREIGDVDALFVGMECNGAPMSWIYGPLITQRIERQKDHSRRLAGSDFERAKSIVDQFHCKEVYVYAMGQEPWLNYVMSVKYTEASKP